MADEKSAGAVVFFRTNNGLQFLLLQTEKGQWDFPKGQIEKGEKPRVTAVREVKEESDIDVSLLPDFEEKIEYYFKHAGKLVHKFVYYFLGEAKSSDAKVSFEHKGFVWLDFDKAMKTISFENSRKVLEKANAFLLKREKSGLKQWLKM